MKGQPGRLMLSDCTDLYDKNNVCFCVILYLGKQNVHAYNNFGLTFINNFRRVGINMRSSVCPADSYLCPPLPYYVL